MADIKQINVNSVTYDIKDPTKLPLTGGNMSGHIYLTGAQENSSTGSTSQIVFGTSSNNHVVLSSNANALVINPNTSSATNQIVLYLDKSSLFPNGITGNLTGTASNASKVSNVLTIKLNGGTAEGTNLFTYNGSAAKTLNITPSSIGAATTTTASSSAAGLMSAADKSKLDGIAAGANNYTYTLPNATSSTLGGVKIGSNITVSSGTISLTKANVTAALGYTPPMTDTNTKNTTGTTNTTSKIFLAGATSQATNPTTYSNVNCYAFGGYLYSGSTKVSVEGHTHTADDITTNVVAVWG